MEDYNVSVPSVVEICWLSHFIHCNKCTIEKPKKCPFNQLFNAYLGLSITCGRIFCDLEYIT